MTMTNGERLRAWRTDRAMSQKACADRVGVSQPTWADWEAGNTAPDREHAPLVQKLTRGRVRADGWPSRKKRDESGSLPDESDHKAAG